MSKTNTVDEREKAKQRHERYRRVAQALHPYATVRYQCAVNETADRDGAFLEVVIFIPSEYVKYARMDAAALAEIGRAHCLA